MEKYIKSPLNYIGGKYKLLRQIIPLFPQTPINLFVDLFCGGCNVGINVNNARTIVLNDNCKQIIELYKELQNKKIDDIIQYIETTIETYNLTIDNNEGYLNFRRNYNEKPNPLDFFILICYSFNHQFRFNKNGEFNMPFGKNRSKYNDNIKNNLIKFVNEIQTKNVKFANKDFMELNVSQLNENDFVYVDPPYLITCAPYNENGGWGTKQEDDLLNLLDAINDRGVKFALSNVFQNKGFEHDKLIKWSEKYKVNHLNNTYSNCNYHAKVKDKETTDEVLITNYLPKFNL